jgi:hypothetical protein
MRVIELCMDGVCWDTGVRRIEESTRGIAHRAFHRWYRGNVGERTASERKTGYVRESCAYGAQLALYTREEFGTKLHARDYDRQT